MGSYPKSGVRERASLHNLALNFKINSVEGPGSDKHTILQYCSNNYKCKKVNITGPQRQFCGLGAVPKNGFFSHL